MSEQKPLHTPNAIEDDDPIVAVPIRVTPEDRERIRRKANSMGLSMLSWARLVLGLDQPAD